VNTTSQQPITRFKMFKQHHITLLKSYMNQTETILIHLAHYFKLQTASHNNSCNLQWVQLAASDCNRSHAATIGFIGLTKITFQGRGETWVKKTEGIDF